MVMNIFGKAQTPNGCRYHYQYQDNREEPVCINHVSLYHWHSVNWSDVSQLDINYLTVLSIITISTIDNRQHIVAIAEI